jgi:hypothetical protein
MSRKVIPPTDEEDAVITAAALGDPDAQPLSDEQLENLCPLCALHPTPNETTIAAMREAEEMLVLRRAQNDK